MALNENSRLHATEFPYHELDGEDEDLDMNSAQVQAHIQAEVLEALRATISYVRSTDNARLTVDCLFLSLGDAEHVNVTMSSVGNQYGITKAAISKRVKRILRDLHLPITANNKSAQAAHEYARTNRTPLRVDHRLAARGRD